ncbi:DUF423 domain-containing protein [Paraflavitalea sp. CAU 1676]|uniref:DUF423 domain-containing protein n=1 Tax=Paraflavitalea sp. CAU 1676 TaxID=3032598 RepID=UPI0023DA04D9|nr:DUF423 domain-containing protein [Paraflavitalea sp. CAU 1676]MDF2192541.1 DUF423 domain-containing protein [Paraflavitalea sp. CAU 1676]
MHKGFLTTAALLGALSVTLGAFGAHGLKKIVPPETVGTFETGVRYQFYHVFALLVVAILFEKFPGDWMRWAGLLFIIGIVLFSGSLYVLTALKATNTVGLSGIGAITPIGGLFFIAGWIAMFVAIIKK